LNFSIIIPVYNRPEELDELLQSIQDQECDDNLEVVVVEDGSTDLSNVVVQKFSKALRISYFFKENSGPGDSRNFGMQKAVGDYFIILDSDCVLPKNYIKEVQHALQKNYTDAYGGADAAHQSFSVKQKAINYSMTSFFTTGGIRGSEKTRNKFQLRSFNMGISRKAFEKTNGFSRQHYGEDIDLNFKLWENNFTTQFIPKAFVYHKRRTTWKQFFQQTFNFGAARPILNEMHKKSGKITFWFPSVFSVGLLISLVGLLFHFPYFLILYLVYFCVLFFDSLLKNKNVLVAFYSVFATLVQFFGYGFGFLRSIFRLHILELPKENAFPKMFR
jgi:glycosyltransferase involved in cell wall biosynthesis